MAYNDRDLLSESKDANNKITYYKYDALNRLTETGEKQGSTEVPLSRIYYDIYPGEAAGFRSDVGSGYPTSWRSNVKGLATATAARILNPDGSYGSWLYTATYYNDRLQVIQTARQLFDLGSGAVEYSTSSLRYDGRMEKQMISQQTVTGNNSIEKNYSYDHADRVLAVKNTVRKESTVKLDIWLSATRYNGIGLVKNKYLHSANGSDYRQRLTHTFTPRSWLKKIEGQTGTGSNFGIELKYTDPGAGAWPQYNGNIAEMLWRRGGSWVGYKFSYDGANRLMAAEGIAGNNYREYDIIYDENGNINTLKRYDGTTPWDNLSYTYYQGRLNTVTDVSVSNNGVKPGTSVYQFDNAGNLTSDGNKAAGIAYNILNLPRQISANNQTLQYHYDGTGAKQRMSNTNGTVNTKYAGIFEYNENNYLTRIATDEGQIAVTSNGNTYATNYYLKDHLGNVRTVIDGNGTILQETDYFAFGLAIPRSGTDAVNRYQYNGKEKQPETGWLDYGARMYMPEIGRWGTVDPLSNLFEDLSGYVYAVNNPLRYVDHDGMFASDTVAKSIELKEVVVIGAKRPDKPTTATQKLVSLEGWVPYLSEYRDYKFDKFEGTFPQYLGDIHRQTPRPSTYHGGTPPGLIGFTKVSPADLLKLARMMKILIRKGRAPSQIKRIDTPVTDPSGKVLHGEQVHIHLQDGRALRADGTWKHGEGEVPNKVVEWIDDLIKELK